MFQSFDEKVANVSLAFELMMDGGLPQPKVTDIDGDKNEKLIDDELVKVIMKRWKWWWESESDGEEKHKFDDVNKVKVMMDGGLPQPKVTDINVDKN